MPGRPILQLDLLREVNLYATGSTVHSLRSAWATYLMYWEHIPESCSDSQLRQVDDYERKLRVELQKCKPPIKKSGNLVNLVLRTGNNTIFEESHV